MSLNMLRHNIEMLQEVSDSYYSLLEKKKKGERIDDAKLNGLKSQIVFLQTAIKKGAEQEKNG